MGPLLGCSWVLGASWRAPGGSWSRLGGLPGRAWGSFGPPGGLLLELLGPLLKAPLRNRENLENRRQYSTFWVFRGPGGLKVALKSLGNRSQARLGASGGFLVPRGAVLSLSGPLRGPSAWLLGRPWVARGRSERTAPRANQVTASPKVVYLFSHELVLLDLLSRRH